MSMTDSDEEPHLREHLAEFRKALRDVGHDVAKDVEEAPRLPREGAKNAVASAAGIRRKPLKEWD